MVSDENPSSNDTLQQSIGALEVVERLREEMEQWLEEAQDDSKHECLENVVGHLGAMELEYQRRVEEQRDGGDE